MKNKIIAIAVLTTTLACSSIAHAALETGAAVQAQQTISEDEAKSIALKQKPGRVLYVDLDRDDGILKYEVIILTEQNKVFEVEINAHTGQVIKVEQEDD